MMSWIEDILRCKSLSIIGLEKNTGKTESLNYILQELKDSGRTIALTSIGIDGEKRDQVCQIAKPEIELYEGMVFVTTEQHYRTRRLVAEVLDISDRRTSLGRLVTARAKTGGKVLLSGPPDTAGLKELISGMGRWEVGLTIVDGALSRFSHGSPAVCEGLVLATGAAVSGTIPQLVNKTKYVYDLISLEEVEPQIGRQLEEKESGIWAVDGQGIVRDLGIPSALMLERYKADVFRYGRCLYVAGVVSDNLLNFLRTQALPVELIIQDFTRMFALPETYNFFVHKGNRVKVLRRSRLLGVTVNPMSSSGFCLNSVRLREALEAALKIPVYDVRTMKSK